MGWRSRELRGPAYVIGGAKPQANAGSSFSQGVAHIDMCRNINTLGTGPGSSTDWCGARSRRKRFLLERLRRLEQILCQFADEIIKVLDLSINPEDIHAFVSAYPTIAVHIIKRIWTDPRIYSGWSLPNC